MMHDNLMNAGTIMALNLMPHIKTVSVLSNSEHSPIFGTTAKGYITLKS